MTSKESERKMIMKIPSIYERCGLIVESDCRQICDLVTEVRSIHHSIDDSISRCSCGAGFATQNDLETHISGRIVDAVFHEIAMSGTNYILVSLLRGDSDREDENGAGDTLQDRMQ